MNKVREPYKGVWLPLFIFLACFLVGLRLTSTMAEHDYKLSLEVLEEASNSIISLKPLVITAKTLMGSAAIGLFGWMLYETGHSRQHRNMQETAYGSAKWGDDDFTRKMKEKDMSKNWIFTKNQIVSMNMSKTGRNRNCVIIGRPGTGKSRYWLTPNVLNAGDETLVITDPKEELLKSTGYALKEKGFDIKVLNVKSKWRSNHYNPFDYIREVPDEAWQIDDDDYEGQKRLEKMKAEGRNIAEDDVMSLINAIMMNTKSEGIDSTTGDPFWEKAEMVFLQSLFYYTIYRMPLEDRNFNTILRLIRMGEPDEHGQSELKALFDAWEKEEPDNIGVKQWKHFRVSAKSEKMMSTIIMTASARLAPFNIEEVSKMIGDDDMELDRIGKPMGLTDEYGNRKDGKVAYFIVTNPNDGAFNFIAALLYTQIFQMVDRNAAANGGQLATPCNVWMDEFRQLGVIPRFLENWAYVRGLNCGVTIVLQSLSQFKKIYKDEWETGLDCCDYTLFLGSNSKETLEYMVSLLGKQTLAVMNDSRTFARQGSTQKSWNYYGRELVTIDELAQLEKGWGILRMAGAPPFLSPLYSMEKDPMHKYMWEPWTELKGQNNPSFKNSKEWQENHEKYYDHLAEMNQKKNRKEKDWNQLLMQLGQYYQIQLPGQEAAVHEMSEEEVRKLEYVLSKRKR